MKRFFIFLDIDGVMYDWDFIIKEVDNGNTEMRNLKTFKPEAIQSLNHLMEELRKQYRVQLVISSTWRMHLDDTVRTLYQNGVKLKGAIDATPVSRHQEYRGLEIIEYLERKTYENEDYEFVVIDDEYFDFKKYFSDNQIIKTEMFHNALSMELVQSFLNNHSKRLELENQIAK